MLLALDVGGSIADRKALNGAEMVLLMREEVVTAVRAGVVPGVGADGSRGSSGRCLRWDRWLALLRGWRGSWCGILLHEGVLLRGNSPLALQVLDPVPQLINVGPEFRKPNPEGQKIVPNSPNSFLQTNDLVLQGWGGEGTIGPAATETLIQHDDDCPPQASNQSRTPRSVDGPPF